MKPSQRIVPQREVTSPSRRGLLVSAGLASAALAANVALAAGREPSGQEKQEHDADEAEIAPPEDLMREHGVLNRVLLIYDETLRRLDAKQEVPPNAVRDAAAIVRSFIEDYHEKLEEDYLFPRFEKAHRLADLTSVLRAQHQAGRRLTDQVAQLASLQTLKDSAKADTLKNTLRQFNRMYRPHEAREDTVLFPALRAIVSKQEFGALGEEFEKQEHQLFGQEGFEKIVDRVATIEKSLGIYDLAQFTPRG